jgi:heme A synthase
MLLHSAERRVLNGIHATLGIVVLCANALAAGWGAVAWLRNDPSVWFWYLLRVAQVTVVAQVALGMWLLISGNQPEDELHYLYGVAILVVTMVSEGMRVGAAQRELDEVEDVEALDRAEQGALARRVVLREMGVMTIGTLLVVTLALRAGASAGGFGI